MKAAGGKDSRSGLKIKRAQPANRRLASGHRRDRVRARRQGGQYPAHATRCTNQPRPAHNTAWEAPRCAKAPHDQRAVHVASGTRMQSKAI
jgi:hypothetical protein